MTSQGELTKEETQAWLEQFKLAIIQKRGDRIIEYLEHIPQFESVQNMQQALALIQEALTFFEAHKKEIRTEMQKIRQTKNYLKASS